METLAKLPGPKRVILFSEGLYVGMDMKLLSRAETLAAQAQATVTVIKPESATHDASASGPSIANDPTIPLLDRGLDQIAGATGGTLAKVDRDRQAGCSIGSRASCRAITRSGSRRTSPTATASGTR